ncbi:hypothetical protein BGZ70_008148 [Mortierella alpina]|uniref:Peptidase M13 N-terminal domain-containing protein n=1 Tax=Mortierella alpina TaxID=64518 RepID=A0A9P6J4Q2_MORAP|nr:hypothetical protein BGZ70_008148 [Mortierella alpina]
MLVMRYLLEPRNSDPSILPGLELVARQILQKLRNLYTSCMKIGTEAVAGSAPQDHRNVPSLCPNSRGEHLEAIEEGLNRTGLSLTLSYFNKLGLNTMAHLTPAMDTENSSKTVLALLEGGAGLNGLEHYLDQKIMDMYTSAVAKMFGLVMGSEAENDEPTMATVTNISPEMILPSHWEDIAQHVVDFERRLAESFTDTGLLLDDLLPADVKRTHSIVVISPSYQERLEVLLQTTQPKTLQAYFVWTAIRRLVQNLDPIYDLPLQQFEAASKHKPAKAIPDRWRQCVEVVNWNLGQIGRYFFMTERYKDGSHELVTEMVDSLRSIYETILPSLSWLDPSTTAGAFEKLKALVILAGFSPTSSDAQSSESLQSYYEDYHVHPDQFFENDLRFLQWRSALEYRFLEGPLDRVTNMPFSPQTVNAYFEETGNSILLPVGMLQPAFFHVAYPEYVNYGALDSIIGHEFTDEHKGVV